MKNINTIMQLILEEQLWDEDLKEELAKIFQNAVDQKVKEKIDLAEERVENDFFSQLYIFRDSLKNSIKVDKSEIKEAITEFFNEQLNQQLIESKKPSSKKWTDIVRKY